jgi:hypothetical protein
MKLHLSSSLTAQEVNLMFAGQQNQLAEQLSAAFAANRLQADVSDEESSGRAHDVQEPLPERSEGQIRYGSMTPPAIDKQVAAPSPASPPPQPSTEDVPRSPLAPLDLFPPSPRRPTTTLPRPPTPEGSPMVMASPSGDYIRPETPPSPTPDRWRSTRQGKQPQPRPLTPPPTKKSKKPEPRQPTPPPTRKTKQPERRPPTPPPKAPVRAKPSKPSKPAQKTDKKLKRVLYGDLPGDIYRKPHFLDTPPTPVSNLLCIYHHI